MKPILFVTHRADRTGAPIVLLHFLRWLKRNSDIPFEVLIRGGGPLAGEHEQIAKVINLRFWGFLERNFKRIRLEKVGNRLNTFFTKRMLRRRQYSLLYSNTATNHSILAALTHLECPVITHIHELNGVIINETGLRNFQNTVSSSDYLIAASKAVARNLTENHSVPEEKISVVYEAIPAREIDSRDWGNARRRIRNDLGILPGTVLIGGMGYISRRKGTDLFIRLADQVLENFTDRFAFVWIGGGGPWARISMARSAERSGWRVNQVHWTGSRPNPLDYLASLDIFCLTSREDPYPLVMLEAAALGRPVVGFSGSGGFDEFVRNVGGVALPFEDVDAMVAEVIRLANSPHERGEIGDRLREKVLVRHDMEVMANQLLAVIRKVMAQPAP